MDRSFVGYSLEHNAMPGFVQTQMLNNLMSIWRSKTGGRPGIRLGGSAMDKTTYVPNFNKPVIWTANPSSQYLIGPSYFNLIRGYFPDDTQITFGLNLGNSTDNWDNTIEFAVAADKNIPQVDLFEIGNEVDLFSSTSKHRPQNWTGIEYAEEWKTVANLMKAVLPNVRFQPAVFAGSLEDGFDLSSLIKAGINGTEFKIPTYSLHFYPQSACSGNQNLDRLVDHGTLREQLQRFDPEIVAAEAGGARFTLAESNSVSCSGAVNISDTFGSALWLVNYALSAATKNIERIYFHNGPTTAYSLLIPKGAGGLSSGVRPMSYGVYFLAEALALPEQGSTTKFLVTPVSLPDNPPDLAVYGLYSNRVQKPDLDAPGTTTMTFSTTVLATSTIALVDRLETIKDVLTRTIRSVVKSVKTITTSTVITITKPTTISKRTTLSVTKTTTTRVRLTNGRMVVRTIRIVSPRVTTTVVPSITYIRSTSKRTITSQVRSTIWTTRLLTTTKTVSRAKPLTSTSYSIYPVPTALTSTAKVIMKPQASDIGDFPLGDGVFLARAVILNLSRYNTSDENVLDCPSCSGPSPSGFGTQGPRNLTSVTLTGFQPNHRLKLVRLRGPGLNAKSGVNVSGIAFSEETGEVTSAPRPGTVIVDKTGSVRFQILASEAVLLVDEKVK
ncbi:hypothetical protein TWF730_010561 [Orbilia blumenaviensis]|uniref:Beta-glucuronidase C-terminal domain-containing protein n=1 Tax=Orbilia blumenaviensis TaxID=1796055 RepID=A0AAV9UP13_9PEZI